jgi:hypothetical protein
VYFTGVIDPSLTCSSPEHDIKAAECELAVKKKALYIAEKAVADNNNNNNNNDCYDLQQGHVTSGRNGPGHAMSVQVITSCYSTSISFEVPLSLETQDKVIQR